MLTNCVGGEEAEGITDFGKEVNCMHKCREMCLRMLVGCDGAGRWKTVSVGSEDELVRRDSRWWTSG